MKTNQEVKILIALLSISLYSVLLMAQGEFENWYFGNYAGVSFAGSSPAVTTDVNNKGNNKMSANEGCASVSEANGQLLLYTDGVNAWDGWGNQINTSSLKGHASSTQSGTIIPVPGSSTNYYLLTTGVRNEAGAPSFVSNGVNYYVVNTSNGFGAFTISASTNIIADASEKVTAVRCCNGYWVIGYNWTLQRYEVFAVNETGMSYHSSLNAPIQLLITEREFEKLGQLKVSLDGSLVAAAVLLEGIHLMDFDCNSGTLSNLVTLNCAGATSNDIEYYGVEFSPDNDWLYASVLGNDYPNAYIAPIDANSRSSIYRFDLNSIGTYQTVYDYEDGGIVTINPSYPYSALFDTWEPASLQIGPDGVIYVAQNIAGSSGANCLGSIDPVTGAFTAQAICTSSGTTWSRRGLPNLFVLNFSISIAGQNLSCNEICDGSATVTVLGGDSPISYSWSNPALTGAATNTVIDLCTGVYEVTVTDDQECTASIDIVITDNVAFSVNVTDVSCSGANDGAIEITNISGGTSPYTFDIGNGPQSNRSFANLSGGNYSITINDANECSANQDVEIMGDLTMCICEDILPELISLTQIDGTNLFYFLLNVENLSSYVIDFSIVAGLYGEELVIHYPQDYTVHNVSATHIEPGNQTITGIIQFSDWAMTSLVAGSDSPCIRLNINYNEEKCCAYTFCPEIEGETLSQNCEVDPLINPVSFSCLGYDQDNDPVFGFLMEMESYAGNDLEFSFILPNSEDYILDFNNGVIEPGYNGIHGLVRLTNSLAVQMIIYNPSSEEYCVLPVEFESDGIGCVDELDLCDGGFEFLNDPVVICAGADEAGVPIYNMHAEYINWDNYFIYPVDAVSINWLTMNPDEGTLEFQLNGPLAGGCITFFIYREDYYCTADLCFESEFPDCCFSNPILTATISPSASIICEGESVILTAFPANEQYEWSNGAITGSITVSPAVTTVYTVTVTDGNGQTAESSETITVNPVPEILISPSSVTICEGESTTLTVSPAGEEYEWSNTATAEVIAVTPQANTTYTVTVTDGNGCTTSDDAVVSLMDCSQPICPDMNPMIFLDDSVYCGDDSIIVTITANAPTEGLCGYLMLNGQLLATGISCGFGVPLTLPLWANNQFGDYDLCFVAVWAADSTCQDTICTHIRIDSCFSEVPCPDMNPTLSFNDSVYCGDDSVTITINANAPPEGLCGYFLLDGQRLEAFCNINVPLTLTLFADNAFGEHDFCFVAVWEADSTCQDTTDCTHIRIEPCSSACDSLNIQANFTWTKTITSNVYEFTNHSSIRYPYTITYFDWDFNGTVVSTQSSDARREPLSGSPPYIVCLTANYIDPSTGLCCKDTYCDTITPGYCDTIGLKVTIEDTDPVHNDLIVDLEATIGFTDVLHQFPFLVDKVIWDYGDNVRSDMGINPPPYTYGLPGNYQAVVTVIFHLPGEPDLCCILTDSLWICAGHEAELQMRCMNSRPQALAGKDALIAFSNSEPNIAATNYGSYECMMANAGNTGIIFRSLIEFDLSEIERLISLEEATLTLYNSSCASPNLGNSFVMLRRITSPWEENSVTWENQPATTHENEIMLSSSILNSEGPSVIDIKLLLADLLNEPGKNYGIMLLSGDETAFTGVSFGSSDNLDASVRPMLDVCYLKEETVSGLTAMDNTESIRVYPNPSEGVFKIDMENINGAQRQLQVLDIDGKVIVDHPNPNDFETVDLSKFSSGIYIIKVTSDRQNFLAKIIKL